MGFSKKEDLAADLSSEIFNIFAASELAKKRANLKTAEQLDVEKENAIEEFEAFQRKVNASPKLKKTFKTLQEQFLTNDNLIDKIDAKFIEAVLLLDIEE